MTAFLAKIMSYIMTPFCAIFGNCHSQTSGTVYAAAK